jgi:pimeloyl-ACP methyl ester carboxylesterase
MHYNQDAHWLESPEVLSVTFHPRRELGGPGGNGFEVLDIEVEAGVTVGGRFYEAGTNQPTVLFFHGNGEIVSDYEDIATLYTRIGLNFMPVDYRGYGRSTGRPTIASMLADARVIFRYAQEWLSSHHHSGPVVVMGRSLGSAAALEIVSAYPDEVNGLIIDSGFADAVALLVRLGAPPPPRGFVDSQLRQEAKIAGYSGPTLIIHGTVDMIIPVQDAETLHRASPSPAKRLLKIDGAGHNNLMAVSLDQYIRAINDLVNATREHSKQPTEHGGL